MEFSCFFFFKKEEIVPSPRVAGLGTSLEIYKNQELEITGEALTTKE
jgi:hypothetical protein